MWELEPENFQIDRTGITNMHRMLNILAVAVVIILTLLPLLILFVKPPAFKTNHHPCPHGVLWHQSNENCQPRTDTLKISCPSNESTRH